MYVNINANSSNFHQDPWWNPAVEEQAVMRIHRIGQTKSVNIKRFIVKVSFLISNDILFFFGPDIF